MHLTTTRDNVLLTVRSTPQSVTCSGRDWASARGDWSAWPLTEA